MILEVSKAYLCKEYAGDLQKCVSKMDGILWDKERIKAAFNFRNGTEKHFQRYMTDNKQFCIFVEVNA